MSVRPVYNRKKQLAPGKWWIDYFPAGGKGKRVRTLFIGTEPDARAFEVEVRRQHAKSVNEIVSPKIIDVIPEYIEWLKLHRSPNTVRDLKSALKVIVPHFGQTKFPHINRVIIDQYKTERLKKVSPARINKELMYISSIFNFAVRRDYAHTLPFKIEKLPARRPIPRIPHPREIEKFIEKVGDPLKKALILFLYECGLRWTEATHIKWENIDFKQGIVYLEKTKGGKHRLAFLTTHIRDILEPIKHPAGWVFMNPKTERPYTTFKTMFKGACQRAGIKHIHPHLLRHAFATYTLEATGDLRTVQTLLGHSSIRVTEFYTQVATERLKEATLNTQKYIEKVKLIDNTGKKTEDK